MKKAAVFTTTDKILLFVLFTISIPALFLNLGLLPLMTDEPTRALVDLEMMLENSYVTPKIAGEYYYNKPPLFNWIQIGFIQVFGYSNFSLRLPTVLSLIGFATTIYYFVQKEYNNRRIALLSAFMLLSCGRILFWDSFQGLIDISFSWAMFSMFMLVYYYGKKEKYLLLFLTTYILTAIGFLFKGLPAIVFLGITLITFSIISKKIKILFSWKHLLGFLSFCLILFAYYYAYSKENSLDNVIKQLISESSKKAIGSEENKFWTFIISFFHFPFRVFYEFAPWTIFVLFYLRRINRQLIKKEAFLQYLQWVFLANILIYWVSTDIRARYIFMLMPLMFILFARLYFFQIQKKSIDIKFFQRIFFYIILAIIPLLWLMYFFPSTKNIENLSLVAIGGSSILVVLAFAYHKLQYQRWMIFVLLLLLIRFFFNFSVLSTRYQYSDEKYYAETIYEVSDKYADYHIGIFQGTYLTDFTTYHFTYHRQKVIPRTHRVFTPNYLYMCNKYHLDLIQQKYKWENAVVDSFPVNFPKEHLYLVHFPEITVHHPK
jgi:4-amino-4-deoxy-L-arabinose transferase-like glycosyltransferase